MNDETRNIAVVGGGAAGLAAAVAAAWTARQAGISARVRIFEDDERVGRSILATGNGRCNFSNAQIDSSDYYNDLYVKEVFAALESANPWPISETAPNAVLAFFQALGLAWREESEGRLYPATNKASTVLDVLRFAAKALGVEECCGQRVDSVEPPRQAGKPFTLRMTDGAFERADKVICAVGGGAAQKILALDLPFAETRPVLGPLKTDTTLIRPLDNIRVRCTATLERSGQPVVAETGEVLFRKYGLSGIAIYNLSRYAQPGETIALDLVPSVFAGDMVACLLQRAQSLEQLVQRPAAAEEVLSGLVLPLVAEAVLKAAKCAADQELTPAVAKQLAKVLKRFAVTVHDMGDPKQCQVHRGGFACASFSPQTMECLTQPGLFAAGEMLDVDAPCGGYNLHWAWASGLLAGISALN